MPTMMYCVYVGHYSSPAVSKEDVAKLNRYGLRGYVFSRGDYYALKVYSTPLLDKATEVSNLLKQHGFTTELETIDLKKTLHLK